MAIALAWNGLKKHYHSDRIPIERRTGGQVPPFYFMNKNDQLLDIAMEVFKQTLQDFTSSYWNWMIVKHPTDADIRVCSSSYEWLLSGYIACQFYSEEERVNIIREAVKRCHMGYTYDRKHGFVKTKKVRKRVSL